MWRENAAALRPTLEKHALLIETIPISENLTRTASIGLEALDYIVSDKKAPADWAAARKAALDAAGKPVVELLLMAAPAVANLVDLAAGGVR